MRIAVGSEKDSVESEVSKSAGRTPYYLIFEDKKLVKSIKNPFAGASGGAGLSIAQMLFNEQIDLVICGKFGDKMKNALEEKSMKFKEMQGISAKQALEGIE